MSARLMIYDQQTSPHCFENCSRVRQITHKAIGCCPVDVTEVSDWNEVPSEPPPDLIVLLAPVSRALIESMNPLLAKWRSTRVLAAVCKPHCNFSDLATWLDDGLDDFVYCPVEEIDFVTRLRRWIPEQPAKQKTDDIACRLDMLVGESAAFWQTIARIPQIARSTASVLIGGETGVGKELFARAIHYSGARKSRPFIPINCGALPDHLFENELFGHARGAYTDANTSEKGLLAEAEGGTVFLDEVNMLSRSAQAKLLRFLQDGEYRPLGSGKTLTADARVIAASNADLRTLMEQREFREDFYYRLNTLSLRVPTLRERVTDIPLLASHFLARFTRQYGQKPIRVSNEAMRKLVSYPWPGNIRELEGVLHRAVVFGTSNVLRAEDIELPERGGPHAAVGMMSGAKDELMDEFERGYLLELLAEHRGNVSHAARAAGKDRRTLQRLLRKHAIQRSAFQMR